ncbi:MAG TPA: CHAP domain-containing protein [Solirubrobacteraceae bacterium]
MKKIAWCLFGGFGAVSGLLLGLGVIVILSHARPAAAACTAGQETTLPVGSGVVVAATVYDGGGAGAYGLGLAGHYPFAELGLHSAADTDQADADAIGVALGLGHALAPLTTLRITGPGGRSVVAQKRDIGLGGPPIDGRPRAIDLWSATREALGLGPDWSGLVKVSSGPGGVLSAQTSADANAPPVASGLGCPGGGDGGDGGAEIAADAGSVIAIAQSQLGVQATGDCQPYGPCEEWCSLFASWVWRHAGIRVPSIGFSGGLYDWAASHTAVYPPDATPQPGWAVFFGTGPADTSTSVHVALVESVLPDGEITIINGNFAGRVMRTGPCQPAAAEQGCQAPAPIYGYAAPA